MLFFLDFPFSLRSIKANCRAPVSKMTLSVRLAVVARLRTASSNFPCRLRLFDMNRLQACLCVRRGAAERPRKCEEEAEMSGCLAGVNFCETQC